MFNNSNNFFPYRYSP